MRFSLLLSFSYHIYVVYPYQKHTGHVSKLHFKVPKVSGKSLTQHSSAAQQDTVHLMQMSHERLFLVGMGTFIINKFIDILSFKKSKVHHASCTCYRDSSSLGTSASGSMHQPVVNYSYLGPDKEQLNRGFLS